MRYKWGNRFRNIIFILLVTLSFMFVNFPFAENVLNIFNIQNDANDFVNIGMWIITALSGFLCAKLHKPVLKHEIYCRDYYFIDRLPERHILFAFLETYDDDSNSLFFVKGGMCRGKTVLLQRFADDVNYKKNRKEFQKRYHKSRKYSAYYISLHQTCNDIVQEISHYLNGDTTLNTYEKISTFLKKASYQKNTILIIDNISKVQSRMAIETAHGLLYKNNRLKIILGITEETPINNFCTLTPPLFGEMHINELAKKYKKGLSAQDEKEIIRISSGIPSYIRIIFQTDALNSSVTLSNIDDIQKIVDTQLLKLSSDNQIAPYLACLKLCQKEAIPKEELLFLAKASESQLEEIFDAALAREEISPIGSSILMDPLVAECCRKKIPYQEYLLKIYIYYKEKDPNGDIALTSLFMLPKFVSQFNISKNILEKKYKKRKFFLFGWLGNLDKEHKLYALYNEPDLYNTFRYFYLCSLLQLGEYSIAIDALNDYEQSNISLPSLRTSDSPSGFEMQYLIIDLHHLSNQFTIALGEIETILSTKNIKQENMYRLLYLKAHCLKHLGSQLQEADCILKELESKKLSESLKIKVLYSQLAIHLFWGDRAYNYDKIINCLNKMLSDDIPEKLHAMRHLAHYAWKLKHNVNEALKIINDGLETLEKTRWRIIYDFYFEKAEWMRIQNAESKNIINKTSTILNYYERAIQFAEENRDINLACCAQLGKILTEFKEQGQNTFWCNDQLKILDREYRNMDAAKLNINRTYVAYMKILLSNEHPSEEFVHYCKESKYYDLCQHIEHERPLKLTVM